METLTDLLFGHLTPEGRVLTALAPAFVVLAYGLIGLLVYVVRCWRVGQFRDADLESRQATPLTNMWIRLYFAWVIQPVWRLLLRTGIPATAVTTLSVLLATASGISLAAGRFSLGGWLYIFAGICDFLDGRVARAQKSVSRSGAALDSVLDRYSDSVVLVGLSWYYRDSWMLLAVQTALVGSSLVPYIRARGEAAGVAIKDVGFMQRAERIVYLGLAVALSPIVEVLLAPNDPRPLHRLAVVGVVLLAVSTQVTALQRFIHLLGALGEPTDVPWAHSTGAALARNIAAAVVATGFDFSLYVMLIQGVAAPPPLAIAAGCVLGAVINFVINRAWTFKSKDARLPQVSRYGFVSVTSALLNAGGVAVLLLLPGIGYVVAYWLVRGAVFFAWNFPLHRSYVFAPQRQGAPAV